MPCCFYSLLGLRRLSTRTTLPARNVTQMLVPSSFSVARPSPAKTHSHPFRGWSQDFEVRAAVEDGGDLFHETSLLLDVRAQASCIQILLHATTRTRCGGAGSGSGGGAAAEGGTGEPAAGSGGVSGSAAAGTGGAGPGGSSSGAGAGGAGQGGSAGGAGRAGSSAGAGGAGRSSRGAEPLTGAELGFATLASFGLLLAPSLAWTWFLAKHVWSSTPVVMMVLDRTRHVLGASLGTYAGLTLLHRILASTFHIERSGFAANCYNGPPSANPVCPGARFASAVRGCSAALSCGSCGPVALRGVQNLADLRDQR